MTEQPTPLGYAGSNRTRRSKAGPILWGAAAGVCVGLPALFTATALAGGGHGSYAAAKALFPYTLLSTLAFNYITPPFVALALVQFPIYGALCWAGRARSKLPGTLTWVSAAHGMATGLCFSVPMPNFD